MIRLEPPQRFLQHSQPKCFISTVGADLGHEEDLVPPSLKALAHPDFGFSAVIFPAIIEKADSAVHGLMNQLNGCLLVFGVTKVVTTETQRRDPDARFAERSQGYTVRGCSL